jgi:hypothetical protein
MEQLPSAAQITWAPCSSCLRSDFRPIGNHFLPIGCLRLEAGITYTPRVGGRRASGDGEMQIISNLLVPVCFSASSNPTPLSATFFLPLSRPTLVPSDVLAEFEDSLHIIDIAPKCPEGLM